MTFLRQYSLGLSAIALCLAIALAFVPFARVRHSPSRYAPLPSAGAVQSMKLEDASAFRVGGSPATGAHAAEKPENGAAPALHSLQVIRKGSLSLLVPDVERALTLTAHIVRGSGGAIVALNDERPPSRSERRTASATISVPEDRFEGTLERIGALGGLRNRTVEAQEVSDQLVDGQARLRNLRRTEADIRSIMDRAGKIGEVLEAQSQLSSVRDQIERLDAEMRSLQHRVAYSEIDVRFDADLPVVPAAEPSAKGELTASWQAAVHALRDVTLGLIARSFYVLVFAPYWLAAAALFFFIVSAGKRSRRTA